jgi:tryptophanyl-tRNA synthetase
MTAERPRILTGDTPTGQLHLGHWVGSVKRRVELQETHDCYFILANYHAFTTRADKPEDIRRDTIAIVKDYLAMGIDPERSTIFLQSEIPAIHELTFLFAMLLPFNRVMRNPTLKTEIEMKGLGETYSFGFPLYAVGQCADIFPTSWSSGGRRSGSTPRTHPRSWQALQSDVLRCANGCG